ncbi:crossover junction endodeoxyribonuclease RuvC [bacterium]|nr:crossover junction endodeoxyribonuclease RuvC [bacterium]NCQ54895.1 crossover junction endodeoxyribonuclease RuvC [Candidatus Parcubacteria bacterium]NCS66939.1 crossover junction endodeoxyribonuclease RuvC [Candidatus Peregrinibacteria bacterium]NCS95886.1 crossover junction endodeoxyribonuclease RuvC [bacterium]
MIIIGIDPGYERCGFAVLEQTGNKTALLTFGTIKTKPKADFLVRQTEIAQDFTALLERYKPQKLAIEDLFFAQNVTTGLKVAQVRGVLTHIAYEAGLEIVEPKPTEVKKFFCGDGHADKKAMQQMAQLTFNLKDSPKIDDAADAIAMAYYGALVRV